MTKPYGEGTLYAKGCQCDLCVAIRNMIKKDGVITTDGWADPRRGYFESKADFIKRVPDGFLKWPDDHK